MSYIKKYLIHPVKRRIAKYYLLLLKRFFGLRVVAITGSAGKTTTKEMLASILVRKNKTVASFANIDPVYNIPSTILRCVPSTKYLILEMGVEYPNEMDFYLWLAKPDIGVITNIYPTHTLFMKDVEGVAKEKAKLLLNLDTHDFAVINSENKYLKDIEKKIKAKVVKFGKKSDIKAENIKFTKDFETEFSLLLKHKKIKIKIPILGKQFIENTLAAASVANILGYSLEDIKIGLEKYNLPEHRMRVIKHKSGSIILDDTYNNNPAAAKEAINTLAEVSKGRKKVVVFGDMLELGSKEAEYHKEIGRLMAKLKIDYLIGVGNLARYTVSEFSKKENKRKSVFLSSKSAVPKKIKTIAGKNSLVLLKGSRSIGLDKIVSQL